MNTPAPRFARKTWFVVATLGSLIAIGAAVFKSWPSGRAASVVQPAIEAGPVASGDTTPPPSGPQLQIAGPTRSRNLTSSTPAASEVKSQRARPAPVLTAGKKQAYVAITAPIAGWQKQEVMAEEKALLDRHPEMAGKFEVQLVESIDRLQRDGEEASRAALKQRGVIFADNGRDLAVIVFPEEGTSTGTLRRAMEDAGATVIRQDDHTLKLAVPLPKLAALSSVDGVGQIRTLRPPRESTVFTQGKTTTLASNWQTGGASGAGAKVAVVDFNFGGYPSLQSQGELPLSLTTVNYSAAAMDAAGSNHGSACAEIVYDIAPAANLVLIKIDDITDLVTAASYCAANGVNVVSCSLGFDGMSFHDGLAQQNVFSTVATHPVTAVANAAANGILWVNAAGNEQRAYTLIDWRDSNSDTLLDWTSSASNLSVLWLNGSTSIPSGVPLDVIMSWNQWGTTNQDFDLLLFKNTGSGWTQITTGFTSGYGGTAVQNGSATSYPFEEILYQTTDASAQYAVAVAKYSATTSPKFLLRYYGADEPNYFGYGNTATPEPGSLAIPGDSASAFTVGALDWNTYITGTIEPFSSLGPNNRGYTGGTAVTKPDICGPDFVDTVTRGVEGFGGTSAATPHIAGLAALARAAYPAMTLTELRTYLEAKALDRGTAGKDNTYGAGAARVTSEAPPVVSSINRASATPASPGSVQFTVTFNKSVTGGATGNFQLATTGVTGASITSVTGSGTTRTVTVNTGTGTGTVGLDMVNSTGVADAVSNAVASLPFTGQTYTIAYPDVTLTVSPSSMAEDAAGAMVYTFTRSGSPVDPLTVNFTVGGTAALTTDYTQSGAATFSASAGTVVFGPGVPSLTVSIDPVADAVVEASETIVLTLASGTGYNVGSPASATGTISNDDTEISVTASPSSANEESGVFGFTFTRAGVTTGALTANFSVGGTATFGSDYSQSGAASFSTTAGTVNFAAGATTTTVTLTSIADITMEADESASLTVTAGTGYNVGAPSSAGVVIINDEASISVSVSPSSMNEDAAGTMVYTFTRTGYSGTALTVGFNVGGTATYNTDYTQTGAASFSASSGTVQFGLGATTVTVTIDPTADATPESDETVILSIASSINYLTGSPSSATGTVTNDDASAVSVAVSPASMAEDAAGTMAYTFTRSGPTTSALTVNFSVSGTAALSTDYTQTGAASFGSTSGTVIFAAGSSTTVINVDPTVDTTVESDETAILTVTGGAGYTVGSPSAATGTITNDDTSVGVAAAPTSMGEDAAGTMALTFTRSGVTAGALTVNFSVSGTATFSTDYAQTGAATFGASSGTVTFAAGSSTAVINLDPTVDTTIESDETAILTVTGGAGYTVGSPSAATGTITNDDTSVSIAAAPTSMAEDAAGTMAFTLTRSGVTTGALTVNFSVAGTAVFNTDYTQTGAATFSASSGTVTFSAGSSTVVVNVDPTADSVYEPNENVDLTVTTGAGYTAGSPTSASITLTNDDALPVVSWSVATSTVAEAAPSIQVSAVLTNTSSQDVIARVDITGTALDGTDYSFFDFGGPLLGPLIVTIPAGQTSKVLTFYPVQDALDEQDETAVLTFSTNPNPIQGATLGSPSVFTLTIIDDDHPEIVVEQPSGTSLVDGTASIGFGSSPIGSPLVRTFTIRNTGTAALTGLAVSKDGANSTDYVVGSFGTTSVAAGGSTTFDVTFTPSASGARTAAIHIASNDADENPFDIQLTGSGSSTNPISFSDDFDPAIDTPLWSAFGGTATADTIAQAAGPGSTGNSLRFDGTGNRFALTQVLNAQAGGSIGFLVALASGTGSTWETADAGEEVVLEYTLDGGTTFVQFGGPYSYRQWQHVVLPIPVAAQAAAVQFRFRQLANSGPTFDHWALDDVQIGTGVATYAEIGIEQPSGTRLTDGSTTAVFSSAVVGQNSTLTFTIRNQGSASLTAIAATIDGANAGDFTVSSTPPTSVAAAATSTFVVTFAPTAAGSRTAALHVASNDSNENPFDITLSATGIAAVPEIAVEQPSSAGLTDNASLIGFPVASMGGSVTKTFTIRNLGTSNLTGLAITIDGTGSSAFTVTSLPSTSLVSAGAMTFDVTFTSADSSTSSAVLHVASNDADENPFDISIAGQVSVAHTFSNSGIITIPSSGNATPYPSVITVAGLAGSVAAVRVQLNGFTHTYPDDVDIFLVSPSGAVSAIMSDAAGGSSVTNQNYTFDDNAATVIPDATTPSSGNYRPANYDPTEPLPPGGAGTIGTNLLSLAAGGVNGDWKLFVSDDVGGLSGSIASWSLVIETSIPEVVIEEPVGTGLTDGTSSVVFAGIGIGVAPPPAGTRTFTVRNIGPGTLTSLAVSKDGADSTNFTVGTLGTTSLQPGGSAGFTVTFAAVAGVSGTRIAAIHVASNDIDENPFDIALSGLALSTTADTDNDGMNDWGEYQLAALGFDWQADNTALVNTYFAAANSNGLYTPAQVQALHIGAPLIQRSAGGIFTLTIGIDKSIDLTNWNPFPILAPQTTVNGQGKLEFQFTVPDDAAFFRLESQ